MGVLAAPSQLSRSVPSIRRSHPLPQPHSPRHPARIQERPSHPIQHKHFLPPPRPYYGSPALGLTPAHRIPSPQHQSHSAPILPNPAPASWFACAGRNPSPPEPPLDPFTIPEIDPSPPRLAFRHLPKMDRFGTCDPQVQHALAPEPPSRARAYDARAGRRLLLCCMHRAPNFRSPPRHPNHPLAPTTHAPQSRVDVFLLRTGSNHQPSIPTIAILTAFSPFVNCFQAPLPHPNPFIT